MRHREIFQFCDAKREKQPEAEYERRERSRKRCAPLLVLGNAAVCFRVSGDARSPLNARCARLMPWLSECSERSLRFLPRSTQPPLAACRISSYAIRRTPTHFYMAANAGAVKDESCARCFVSRLSFLLADWVMARIVKEEYGVILMMEETLLFYCLNIYYFVVTPFTKSFWHIID